MNLFDQNQFAFTCPVFNAETRMSACVTLREKVWRGERVTVRRGCQACMRAGKCPAATVVARVAMQRDYSGEEYVSATPVKGKLTVETLERIAPVMVLQSHIIPFGPSAAEIDLIATAGQRIAEQMKSAPSLASRPVRMQGSGKSSRRAFASAPKSQAPVETAAQAAARSGDLSQAINQETP